MEQEKYFEMVEKVLRSFPSEYSENYFANKIDVKIEYKEKINKNLGASYNHEENHIEVYNKASLPHELFHMSFRDRNKINQKVWEDLDIFYDNGVVLKRYENNESIVRRNIGITEGFAEYLARKCSNHSSKDLHYYFVDLLISIHGEDIVKYPLLNDPIGLLNDNRFFDIFDFTSHLDDLDSCISDIVVVNNYRDTIEEIFKSSSKEEAIELLNNIGNVMVLYKKSIVALFESIINEYKNCVNTNIDIESFIKKIELFLTNSSYMIAFGFDNDKYSVKEKLLEMISKLKKENKVVKTKNKIS